MSIFGQHQFTKGVNRRTPIERTSPDSFYKLKNCRINKRGETGFITPIEGIETVATLSGYNTEYIFDSCVYDDYYIVLGRKTADGKLWVNIFDKSSSTVASVYESVVDSTPNACFSAKLTVLDNNILISPYNKYLVLDNVNNIKTWYITDFVSTTPVVAVDPYTTEDYASGEYDISTLTGIIYPYTATLSVKVNQIVETTQNLLYNNAGEISQAVANAINIDTPAFATVSYDLSTLSLDLNKEYTLACYDTVSGEFLSSQTTNATYGSATDLAAEFVSKFASNFPNKLEDFELTNVGSVLIFTCLEARNKFYGSFFAICDILDNSIIQIFRLPIVPDQSIFTDFLTKYSVTSDSGVLTVKSKIPGSNFTSIAVEVFSGSDYLFGIRPEYKNTAQGNLKSNTEYWYAARYRYLDGHRTRLSVPVKFDTNGGRTKANLTITTDTNYNNSIADIEVYRKESESDWFLIDTIKTIDTGLSSIDYVDVGESEKQPLSVNEYIWDENHETQTVVRDRVVRGNLKFSDKRLNLQPQWFKVTENTATTYGTVPINTSVDVYVKPRFTDGTDGFHQKIGKTLTVSDINKSIQVEQVAPINNSDIQQLSYYVKYKQNPTNEGIKFSSFELMNKNIPSISTHEDAPEKQEKPATPKIFLGFRYIVCVETFRDVDYIMPSGLYAWCGNDSGGWGRSVSELGSYWVSSDDRLHGSFYKISEGLTKSPNITVDYYGQKLPYKLITASKTAGDLSSNKNFAVHSIYELAFYNSLVEAIDSGNVMVELEDLNVSTGMSSVKNEDVIGSKIKVVGIEDKSKTGRNLNSDTGFYVDYIPNKQLNDWQSNTVGYESPNVPLDSRIYLLLDSESVVSEFSNLSINKNEMKMEEFSAPYKHPYSFYGDNLSAQANMTWVLSGLVLSENYKPSLVDTFDYAADDDHIVTYERFTYPNLKLIKYFNIEDSQSVLFIGSNLNSISPSGVINIQTLGYSSVDENGLLYWSAKKSNLYETLLEECDIKHFTSDYGNQLIWSDPYVPSSYASGFRLFRYENFLNIPSNYGVIVATETIGGKLYVFCEKAVRQVNVGEVLTQQASGGQLTVNSTTFLNDGFWVIENIQGIKPKSIKVYNNSIIFGDGIDIWLLGDGLKNISDGRVTLDGTKEWVGVIDPKYKEYIVTDGTDTWSYSFELGEWFGSHGYKYLTGAEYGSDLFGVIGSNIVKHNVGDLNTTTFGDVEVEGVAYFADPNITTTWRKFYIEASPDNETVTSNPYTYNSVDVPDNFDQAEFAYSSIFGYWTVKDLYKYTTLDGVVKKNGLFHIGVAAMPYEDLDVLLTDGTNTLGLSDAVPTDHLKLTEDTIINKNARYMYWRIKHKNINPALVIKSVKFEGLPKERR